MRTRTLVLQTPYTKRSPPEHSLKGRLVPSVVPLVKTLSISAKNRDESTEDTRIVRFIWDTTLAEGGAGLEPTVVKPH